MTYPISLPKAWEFSTLAYRTRDHMSVRTDTQIVIRHSGNLTYIAFRGTTNIFDWETNSHFFQQEFPYWGDPKDNVKFHSGYLCAYDSVRQYILDVLEIRSEHVPGVTAVCCGHSLGGATALVAAHDLSGVYPVIAHTFGAPRAMNGAARDHLNVLPDSRQVRNFWDPVWRLPLWCHGLKHPCDSKMKVLHTLKVNWTVPFFIGQHNLDFYGANIQAGVY